MVWTDGACSGNPGPGGWAWATEDGRQASGGSPLTTNQRMEIQAALEAVRALDGPLVVVSDSTYVVNCFRDGWWQGWLARGWMTSAKKPVANRDLWEPLVTAVRERGDRHLPLGQGSLRRPMNDLVDQLAVRAGQAQAPFADSSQAHGASTEAAFSERPSGCRFGRFRLSCSTHKAAVECRSGRF